MIAYRVKVGGKVGVVYEGDNSSRARDEFYYYAREARDGWGSATGNPVMFEDTRGMCVVFDPKVDGKKIPRV